MKVKIVVLLGILLVAAIGLYGYSLLKKITPAPRQENEKKLQVTASFYPLYFFTTEIARDFAHVYNLTPAGAEPHDYEPTAQAMAQIRESDMLVVNGAIEPWLPDIREELARAGIRVVKNESLFTRDFTDEDGEKVEDPHVWLSPRLAELIVATIANGLTLRDPVHADVYSANAEELRQQLAALDKKFRDGLLSCPQKEFITAHSAFGYLAAEYGLTQVSIAGLSPEAEPGPQTLIELSKLAREKQIKYIFFETLTSPELSETLAKEIGAQTIVLNPIEGLTDQEIAAGKNYFTEMEQNLRNLRTALNCE